jgi:hypothetical protein
MIFHLHLGDFFQLGTGDLANLGFQRIGRALVSLMAFLIRVVAGGVLMMKVKLLSAKAVITTGKGRPGSTPLGLGIECLAELHDVEAALTQRRTNGWGWVGLASWHLQLDKTDDFFRHSFLLSGANASDFAEAPRD